MKRCEEYRIAFLENNSVKYVICRSLEYFSSIPHRVGRAAYSSQLSSEIAFMTARARTRRLKTYGRHYL